MQTLAQAIDSFLLSCNGSKSPATLAWYRHRLASLAEFVGGSVSANEITIDDLRRWRVSLVERRARWEDHPVRPAETGGLSAYTLHGYVRAVRHFFKWLADEGRIPINPAARLALPKLPRTPRKGISQDDLEAILSAARASSERDLALVWFLASTGCRCGGVVSLTLRDLDLGRGRAIVREKGDKSRTVYLVPQAVDAMRAWLAVRALCTLRQAQGEDQGGAVFLGRSGRGLAGSGVYQVVKRLARAAAVADLWNPHQWRHALARRMLADGAGLGLVQQILGHESADTTARYYGTLADEELARAHARFAVFGEK